MILKIFTIWLLVSFLWAGYHKKDQPVLSMVDLEEIFAYFGMIFLFSIFGNFFMGYIPSDYRGFIELGYVFFIFGFSLWYTKKVYVWNLRKES